MDHLSVPCSAVAFLRSRNAIDVDIGILLRQSFLHGQTMRKAMKHASKDHFGLNFTWGDFELALTIRGLGAVLRAMIPFRRRD